MSQTNDPKREQLEDRLMDQALRELLGGEAPPDLSGKILAAVEKQGSVSPQRKERVMNESRGGYRLWAIGAIAACLVAGAALAILRPEWPLVARAPDARPATAPDAQLSAAPEEAEEVAIGAVDTLTEAGPGSGEYAGRTAEAPATDADDAWLDRLVIPPAGAKPGPAGKPSPDAPADLGATAPTRPAEEPTVEPAELPDFRDLDDLGAEPDGTRTVEPAELSDFMEPRRQMERKKKAQQLPQPGSDQPASNQPGSELWSTTPEGTGPGRGGDQYDHLVENPFRTVKDHPLSTFSIDVDTASYANARRALMQENRLPQPDAVRIEELINYFDYDYAGPKDDVPFAAHIEVAGCPWQPEHRLVRVGLKGKEVHSEERPPFNLVFLLDVSGSMDSPDKLPLLKEGMKLLAARMEEKDRVAIVVYAGAEGLVLPSTPGSQREKIIEALDRLQAGGSTNGGAGIDLAYKIAQANFIKDGVNRVLLGTDGDFNVGTTGTGNLVRMVEERATSGVFLSVLGFGRGNLNDAMMENISNKGNGNYAYIDNAAEARKVLVQQMSGTLVTIAKDVKIQIEFNPAQVSAYRLIGYENRILAAEDFNDDKKDAGEIGAGHTVTALYEVVPSGVEVDVPSVDPLKYQKPERSGDNTPESNELLTLKLRYKAPDGDTSKLLEFPVIDAGTAFSGSTPEFQFASAVASFGMLLRDSEHKGDSNYAAVLEIATSAKGPDVHGYRAELLDMVRKAKQLSGR